MLDVMVHHRNIYDDNFDLSNVSLITNPPPQKKKKIIMEQMSLHYTYFWNYYHQFTFQQHIAYPHIINT